jgi:hypothetical protein
MPHPLFPGTPLPFSRRAIQEWISSTELQMNYQSTAIQVSADYLTGLLRQLVNTSPSGVGYAYLIGRVLSPRLGVSGFITRFCGAAERLRIQT